MKILPCLLTLAFVASAYAAPENLLRNGSFEGGLLYWHQIDPKNDTLVRDAAVGEFALRIAKGNVMSAPFVAVRGEPVTVSFFVKGEKPGRVGVQMPPSAREPGTKAHRLWQREAEQSAEIGTEWKRVSFTWNADVPQEGFWPNPHYLVQIGGYDQPILVDGVTVVRGKEGTPAYVPRAAVEAVAECANLPGWNGAAGNAFDKGATAQMVAHVSNPGAQSREVTVRWQLMDFEGALPLTKPVQQKVTVPLRIVRAPLHIQRERLTAVLFVHQPLRPAVEHDVLRDAVARGEVEVRVVPVERLVFFRLEKLPLRLGKPARPADGAPSPHPISPAPDDCGSRIRSRGSPT